jgi:N-carbamoyl-L-amino-acid hydrolase
VRDIEMVRRDLVLSDIRQQAQQIGDRRKQQTTIELINADPPATSDARITCAIEDVCIKAGLSYEKMVSRAYHDSLFMALVAPTAMIFILCRDGVSHRPDEYASPRAIVAGVRALALTVADLSEA